MIALSETIDDKSRINFETKYKPFILVINNLNPKGFKAKQLGISNSEKVFKTVKITSNRLDLHFNAFSSENIKSFGGPVKSLLVALNNTPFTLKKANELNLNKEYMQSSTGPIYKFSPFRLSKLY